MTDIPDHDATEEEIAADAAKRTAADEHIRKYTNAGWIPDKHGGLYDPADPSLSIWRDPYTHEVLLSPELVERLSKTVPYP